jgi:signal transduction histidine kinase
VKRQGTLRSHVIWGAILWTIGLVAVSHVIIVALNSRFPKLPLFLHGSLVMIGAIVCMIVGLSQIRRAISPVQQLREKLGAVRNGSSNRVEGNYPGEIQPLVNELNSLLDHQENQVTRAIARAGDLAHGLKTPLAILSQEADRAEKSGQTEIASTINQQVSRMRRQVDYHLAHARAAASGATPGTRSSVLASAEALSRTLQRLYGSRSLNFKMEISPVHEVRVQREDLDEMLGNLLDNSCKWAKSSVIVRSSESNNHIQITIDDDGPGLSASLRSSVLQRGVRADEESPGSGLGLAIVKDLAELYGGSIYLDASLIGGLRAVIDLPAA